MILELITVLASISTILNISRGGVTPRFDPVLQQLSLGWLASFPGYHHHLECVRSESVIIVSLAEKLSHNDQYQLRSANSVPDTSLSTSSWTMWHPAQMILPGCQDSDSASSSKIHHFALLMALVSHSPNFHHWPLLALFVALVLHWGDSAD